MANRRRRSSGSSSTSSRSSGRGSGRGSSSGSSSLLNAQACHSDSSGFTFSIQ